MIQFKPSFSRLKSLCTAPLKSALFQISVVSVPVIHSSWSYLHELLLDSEFRQDQDKNLFFSFSSPQEMLR